MAKPKSFFVCQSCGAISPQWSGRCAECDAWNTLLEELETPSPIGNSALSNSLTGTSPTPQPIVTLQEGEDGNEGTQEGRLITHMDEFDRVCGGGLVPGSVILVGGDPGIGKSTLLLQVATAVVRQECNVLYASGEESLSQVRLRAKRLNLFPSALQLASETNLEALFTSCQKQNVLSLLIVDSIQTISTYNAASAAGTLAQMRLTSQALITFAKTTGTCVILVGHVTKEGQLAGPRVVEHMVDAVFYFEGDGQNNIRLLRATKNRFGPTNEIGLFEMEDKGLRALSNPSTLFLESPHEQTVGKGVCASMEGTRPLFIEAQALLAQTNLAMPRRTVVGWDQGRLAMLLAILEARGGMRFSNLEVYLNIAGGFKVSEPAADLAVAAALVSCLKNKPWPAHVAFFGEMSLSGSIRPVFQTQERLKEAQRLGFERVFSPPLGSGNYAPKNLIHTPISTIVDLISQLK